MNTYSFLDCILNLVFPPSFTMAITGAGIGDMTVSMAQERAMMEAAADGVIMVSKIAGNHGQIVINVQQTSDAHKFLLSAYNALIIAPPALWAQGAGILRSLSDSTSHTFTGMCFQKLGDKGYEKQGKMVTWTILCGDIQTVPF